MTCVRPKSGKQDSTSKQCDDFAAEIQKIADCYERNRQIRLSKVPERYCNCVLQSRCKSRARLKAIERAHSRREKRLKSKIDKKSRKIGRKKGED